MLCSKHGRVVQVDPIKPMLKAPGIKRLKLIRAEPLSNLAFKFKMRRYNMADKKGDKAFFDIMVGQAQPGTPYKP